MAEKLELRNIFTVEKFVTEHIATYAFWLLELANLLFWVQFIRASGSGMATGFGTLGAPLQSGTPINWWSFLVGIVMLVTSALVIRILLEFVLVFFRWLALTQRMAAAPAGGRPASFGPAGVPAQPLAVSPPPPWEGQAQAQPTTPPKE